mmetsp:Transcript_54579/g.95422  ORF Transcript_54579/g.95422 Transcript_54579/m.95422 type:complete len:167 (-) Transcript_54579:232-732(-)|eukprot:CAMPEP_0184996068 /NCGR_PEP_ID=MMETSP1098-20130426/55049_1 /TAXON_ID=89044 /ORGANISM="Spumella elongata, Strain CCAP 955/1" /LENGTH=166 /DNA_ID=CAMNT_0027522451 /DNA_START=100 /DNA_END=600 /DNA_ORIENTATION=+
MIESDLVNGEDRKTAFPALAIVTTEYQHHGPINGQATLNKYEILSSPVHEALPLTWDKVKYCDGESCTSSSNDQKLCNEKTPPEKEIVLRRHPSYLQRDAFQNIRSPTDFIRKTSSSSLIKACFASPSLSSTFSDDSDEVPKIAFVKNMDSPELNKRANELSEVFE